MLSLELPRDTNAPYAARHAIDELFPPIGPAQRADAQLLLSELVTNGVLHGRGEQIIVQIDVRDNGRLHCEVIDDGVGFTPRARSEDQEVGGWGLDLVERLAADWGVYRGSTHVWFELAGEPDD